MNPKDLAANPNTPADVLTRLARSFRLETRMLVATNPNTPTETLLYLLQDTLQRQDAKKWSAQFSLSILVESVSRHSNATDETYLMCLHVSEQMGRAINMRLHVPKNLTLETLLQVYEVHWKKMSSVSRRHILESPACPAWLKVVSNMGAL